MHNSTRTCCHTPPLLSAHRSKLLLTAFTTLSASIPSIRRPISFSCRDTKRIHISGCSWNPTERSTLSHSRLYSLEQKGQHPAGSRFHFPSFEELLYLDSSSCPVQLYLLPLVVCGLRIPFRSVPQVFMHSCILLFIWDFITQKIYIVMNTF